MKHLQRIFALIAICCVVFSCQKEYSLENNPGASSTSSQWSFTEGSAQFKGPIDTVGRDTVGGYTFLTVNGHSTDKRDQITLQIFGATLKTGTYKTPYCLFSYVRNGVNMYQTNQAAVDSFSIVITKLDSTGVTGTFSGKAYDSSKAYKNIVNGVFSAVFKSKTPVTPPASTDSGQVMLWGKAGCGGGTSTTPVNVSIGNKSGQITQFSATEPANCNAPGTFNLKLPVGNYTWTATCGTSTISGSVAVTKNGCTKALVDFTAPPPPLSGDYFPMTLNSNWSYLYEGGSPADTLFTFSTGATRSFLTSSYGLFTNTDGKIKDSSYYRKSGNTYYEYVPATTQKDSLFTITTPAFEYPFLVDNLAANATFPGATVSAQAVVAGMSIPVTMTSRGVILETGANATIGSLTFSNVIKVKITMSYKASAAGTASDYYAVEEWFAKGIGLIKYIEYTIPPFTTATSVLNITRYKVY